MSNNPKLMNAIMGLIFLLLASAGLVLFIWRAEMMPKTVGRELAIGPEKLSPQIVTDEFLLLVAPSHLNQLNKILDPLNLELRFPLLEWIVVGTKGAKSHTVAELSADNARVARLTLGSLLEHPLVLDAQHNFVMETTSADQGFFTNTWPLAAPTDYQPYSLDVERAWDITRGDKNVRIAVVDHFSANGQFNFPLVFPGCSERVSFYSPWPNEDDHHKASQSPHGGVMLQALGACNNVRPFSSGIDENAHILAAEPPYRGHAQVFLTALLASGIDVCKESVVDCSSLNRFDAQADAPDVLLLPLGNNAPELLQISANIFDAIRKKGVIVVTGAGNDNTNANSFFPGGSPNVINVAALDQRGHRAKFSNWGSVVDLIAPGDNIQLTYPNGAKTIRGSSVAAAYVAGSVALLKSIRNDLTFEEAQHILVHTAKPLSCEQYCAGDEPCKQFCCVDGQSVCGMQALNLVDALKSTAIGGQGPLLRLSQSYFIFLRDDISPKQVFVENISAIDAEVKIAAFDERLIIEPKHFTLKGGHGPTSRKPINISFTREPFIRQTFKFEVSAVDGDHVIDRTEFYVEYIPRK